MFFFLFIKGGPCRAGKSTLASILIGEQIPLQWDSTDGLVIYFGRNGIDIENKKMIPLQDGMFDIILFSFSILVLDLH